MKKWEPYFVPTLAHASGLNLNFADIKLGVDLNSQRWEKASGENILNFEWCHIL